MRRRDQALSLIRGCRIEVDRVVGGDNGSSKGCRIL